MGTRRSRQVRSTRRRAALRTMERSGQARLGETPSYVQLADGRVAYRTTTLTYEPLIPAVPISATRRIA